MKDYLLFRLYGHMASWGDIAVGETRPSYTHPSKSAIIGLIAGAFGISRDEELKHQQLTKGYGFAVCVDNPGIPLSDYHIAQVSPSGTGRNRISFATRRDELIKVPEGKKLTTILSRRDYRMDALVTVILWQKPLAPYSLEELVEKLQYPVYTLYLGRKSCPLALPLEPHIIKGHTIKEVLGKAKFTDWKDLPFSKPPLLYWEEDGEAGMNPQHIFFRRDIPLSRKRWQFDVRAEHQAYIEDYSQHILSKDPVNV